MDNLFYRNKYYNWYFQIINYRQINIIAEGYSEKHHIIPKCMGGLNNKENIVKLTAREHYIVHKLLPKFTKDTKLKAKMYHAIFRIMTGHGKDKFIVSSMEYEYLRIKYCESRSLLMKGFPSKITPEGRKRLSENCRNRKHSDETKQKISQSKQGHGLGSVRSAEIREKISKKLLGHKKTKSWVDKINKNPEKIRKTAEKHRGMKRSIETRKKISLRHKGRIAPNKGFKYYYDPITRNTIMCLPGLQPENFIAGFLPKRNSICS